MKKYNKILDIIITVCSVFIFINYFSYLIKLFIWSEGTLPYVIAFSVIIFIPLLAVLHRRGILAKLFRGSYTALRSIYAFGLAFYMVSFIILCAFILGDEVSQPTVNELPQNTYIITLGAKVNSDGTPGKILAKRIRQCT